MKKFLYCVLLFAAASFVCLAGGYALTRYSIRQEEGTLLGLLLSWQCMHFMQGRTSSRRWSLILATSSGSQFRGRFMKIRSMSPRWMASFR